MLRRLLLCTRLPIPAPPARVHCLVPGSLAEPTPTSWPPPSPLPLPRPGTFIHLDVAWFLLSIHLLYFHSRNYYVSPLSRSLHWPFRNSSYILNHSASYVFPCINHGRLFLPLPYHTCSWFQSPNIDHKAAHCDIVPFPRPMYLASDCIPVVRSNSSASGVSYDPAAWCLDRFPVIWRSNPACMISTTLIVPVNSSQESNPILKYSGRYEK